MNQTERVELIDRLDRSFALMPTWVKTAVKHAMCAPSHHPETGKEFTNFRQVLEAASDYTLETLRDDFNDNGDLLPSVRKLD